MNARLTAVVLTRDEAKHLGRCLESLRDLAADIVVVDSFSLDETVAVARRYGARVYRRHFLNHAGQLNWALGQVLPQTDWVLRLDADEYLTDALKQELRDRLDRLPADVTGLLLRRRIVFLGRRVRWGGFGGVWVLRLWRRGFARCEHRWMDEHMVLTSGRTRRLRGALVDHNLNGIGWWTEKHRRYAAGEAVDLLDLRHRFLDAACRSAPSGGAVRRRRLLKERLYARMPLGLRAVLYYLFRMLPQLGVLESPAGWAFHFLQGLWYRVLVDINIWQVERRARLDGRGIVAAIRDELGIDPLAAERRS